jgi:Cupin-like domain
MRLFIISLALALILALLYAYSADNADGGHIVAVHLFDRPLVLPHAELAPSSSRWRALSRWQNRSALSEMLPLPEVYVQHGSSEFTTFHDNKPLESFLSVKRWHHFNRKRTVQFDALFDENNGDEWLYWSRALDKLDDADRWFDDVAPLNASQLFFGSEFGDRSEFTVQVNAWLGRRGLVTAAHYDTGLNLYFQIDGAKRWTFWPPASDAVTLYPVLHPHCGHMMPPPPSTADDAIHGDDGRIEIVVRAGDALFVPPYWWHRVETLQDSVALNVWLDSPAYLIAERVYTMPMPLELEWPDERKLNATLALFDIVATHSGLATSSPFATLRRELYERRYKPLYDCVDEMVPPEQALLSRFTAAAVESRPPLSGSGAAMEAWRSDNAAIYAHVRSKALAIAAEFARISPASVRRLCATNLIEHLLSALFNAQSIYPILAALFG